MFGMIADELEQISIGNTKMRLLQNKKGKYFVQLWSSLSEDWKTTYRESTAYNEWLEWKKVSENVK